MTEKQRILKIFGDTMSIRKAFLSTVDWNEKNSRDVYTYTWDGIENKEGLVTKYTSVSIVHIDTGVKVKYSTPVVSGLMAKKDKNLNKNIKEMFFKITATELSKINRPDKPKESKVWTAGE